ncbi:MAG TPA: hypothetical protein VGZ01_00520 [Trinickia sp.]|nr:hypothetical protein [Trinickia sp.]
MPNAGADANANADANADAANKNGALRLNLGSAPFFFEASATAIPDVTPYADTFAATIT